jgi:hypothetical protein
MERIIQVEGENAALSNLRSDAGINGRSRVLKAPLIRKHLGTGAMEDLEVDNDMGSQ